MNQNTTPTRPRPHDRRQFLRFLGLGAVGTGAAVAGVRLLPASAGPVTPAATAAGTAPVALLDRAGEPVLRPETARNIPPGQRTLVVVELDGGNDGVDTLVPHSGPHYRRWRSGIGLDPNDVIDLDGQYGLHPNLAGLHERGLAVVAGVGSEQPDLSHFEMAARWAAGDSAGAGLYREGFLGRCCDALRGDEIVSGVSLGWGSVPALSSADALTMSLPDPDGFDAMVRRDLWASELRDGLALMARPRDESIADVARRGIEDALEFGSLVGALPSGSEGYPDDEFAWRLATASRVIRSGAGVRVLHVPLGGFDTHAEHRWQHDDLMRRLDQGVSAFLDEIAAAGMADDVVVATVSEFGRRPLENGSGTDHGAASVALLAGAPVRPGIHGEPSPLDDLDEEDNLRSTVDMTRYYATLSQGWLGLDADDVLTGDTRPLQGVFT